MQIKSSAMDITRFANTVESISQMYYDGNLIVHPDARDIRNGVSGRITVRSSRQAGGRVGHSGRRVHAACWHAYRDVLAAVFDVDPNAIVRTAVATYKGRDGFLRDFEDTGFRNIGSLMSPLNYQDACDC